MTMDENPHDLGRRAYEAYWERQMADPEFRRIYEEGAAKLDLWLQLVEARRAAGLTQSELAARLGVSQSQVARLERRDYDRHTLNTLRRYVAALGNGSRLEVRIVSADTDQSNEMRMAS